MLDKEGLTQEVSVGVTYASLMSAVSLFFTGVLISQYQDFATSIKVPLVFLIISTFSFIFAATIFSNAATELTLNKLRNVQRYMVYGKNIDELLGLYLFILATPMVLGAVTHDNFLRVVTMTVALLGFSLYSQSRFSILDDEMTRWRKRATSLVIVALAVVLYYFQNSSASYALSVYTGGAIALLSFMGLLTYKFCTAGKQYNPTTFRAFDDDDADEMAELILKNLKRLKTKSISKTALQTVRAQATPQAIMQLATDEDIIIAEFKGYVAGFATHKENEITAVFTDPDLHRKGIGRQLVERLEDDAHDTDFEVMTARASSADREFYVRLGYAQTGQSEDKTLGVIYHMSKKLRR